MAGLGLQRLDGHLRLPQPGEASVAQLVAGAVDQPRPGPGAGEDLVEALGGEGLSTSGPPQRDEDPVGGGVGWTLMVHVLGHGGEERARHRDQALVAALALRHEHPPLAQAQVPELKTENLASPQAAEQHGLDHGAVASGA